MLSSGPTAAPNCLHTTCKYNMHRSTVALKVQITSIVLLANNEQFNILNNMCVVDNFQQENTRGEISDQNYSFQIINFSYSSNPLNP